MTETRDTKSLRIDYRHLAFFFLGAVCVCAVFFALGFVVGRAQAFETALKDPEELKNTADGASGVSSAPGSALPVSGKEQASVVTGPAGKAEGSDHGTPRVDYRKDLDFYSAVKEQTADQNFHPESPKSHQAAASAKKAQAESESRSSSTSARNGGSRVGLVSLQVAALKSSADADRLAKTLRSKGYPIFIVNPGKEDPSKLIRVQIGPYASEAEAAKVKRRLGTEGYTAISTR
ncbi:MAG: SPOR domain-containing protein [Acidobacteria bacterium]|nr:SPOR domain-containing protein [Acidobacteriota bacterium]